MLSAAVWGNFSINMSSYHDKMLAVLRDAGVVRVEWRMLYNNDEGDLDSIVATFSDGSRGPLPDRVVKEKVHFELWTLANHEHLDYQGAWTNGLFVLDVNERTVARTAEVFYDHDQWVDDYERIFEERWHEYLEWDGTGEFPLWTLRGSEESVICSTMRRSKESGRRR